MVVSAILTPTGAQVKFGVFFTAAHDTKGGMADEAPASSCKDNEAGSP